VNQYAVSSGSERLRRAIAEHEERFYGARIDPATMITVTSGGTEACFDSVLGLVDPGDEVILFEPYYDSYAADVELAGAVPRYVLLRPPDEAHPETWWFDEAELARRPSTSGRGSSSQQPAEPDRQALHPRRAGAHRRAVPAHTTSWRSPTRSTSTWSTRRTATCASPASGDGGAHGDGGQRGQELRLHRLEDRLENRRAAAAAARPCSR
jgi:hypothetical protein